LPELDFTAPVTRFTLPVRALTWSGDGSQLAAGGDDMNIKIVRVKDTKVQSDIENTCKLISNKRARCFWTYINYRAIRVFMRIRQSQYMIMPPLSISCARQDSLLSFVSVTNSVVVTMHLGAAAAKR
jgi:WD40 repeat protein